MKALYVLMLLGIFISLDARVTRKQQSVKECFCYCSEICAPRIADKPGDAPFIDPETGICFCQERDRVNYLKNGCHTAHNAKIFNSCCDQMREQPMDLKPLQPKK